MLRKTIGCMIRNSETYQNAIEIVASRIPISAGTVLVTGSTGLIGSCMVDVLSTKNQLYGSDIRIIAMSRNRNKLSDRFGLIPNIEYLVQDVIEPIQIEGIDYIIHTASNADPISYAQFPTETIMTTILGANNIIDYCKNNSARALFTSSFEVYGQLDQDYYSENDFGIIDLNLIRSSYPESKRLAELLFRAAHDEYQIDCVIARLCSVYGPTMQMSDSKAHAQFIKNVLNGESIILKSKGCQLRTYCYVIDAVDGLFTVLFKGESGQVYNVANDQSVSSIAEFANTLSKLSGEEVVYNAPNEIESKGFSKPQNCILVTEKIKSLGWRGRYDLEKGIKETLDILNESL